LTRLVSRTSTSKPHFY